MRVNMKRMSLKKLQDLINQGGPEVYEEVISVLASDPRGGAQKLVRRCRTKLEEWQREQERMTRMFSYERQVWAMGYRVVAGLAEVGRGPLAGPVVAAAVVLPEQQLTLSGLEDCKRLSDKRRRAVYEQITQVARAIGIGMTYPNGLDEANVMVATYKAMVKAVNALELTPDYLLVDALHVPEVTQPQALIVGGDSQSASIAAAAVVAKVARDDYMIEIGKLYPQYGFANHKGYGTLEHREALERYGPCPIHRRNANAVREALPLAPGMFADD